jgi:hypothetical protein
MATISREQPLKAISGRTPAQAPDLKGETAMLTGMKDYPTYVALILAVVAAVMSMPGESRPEEPGGTYRVLEWVRIGTCSEVNLLAGAIGETSAGCPEP